MTNALPKPGAGIGIPYDVCKRAPETQEELTDRRIIAMIVRGCDLFDVFSPERIGKACARHKLIPGPALDLRTGYDLSTEADRRRAFKL